MTGVDEQVRNLKKQVTMLQTEIKILTEEVGVWKVTAEELIEAMEKMHGPKGHRHPSAASTVEVLTEILRKKGIIYDHVLQKHRKRVLAEEQERG